MQFKFSNVAVRGILTLVPANELVFEEEIGNYNFSEKSSLKLKKMMQLDRHRVVNGDVSSSDLACHALNHLFENGDLEKDSFDALLFVSQTPDKFIPPSSNIIQGELGLKKDLFCLDINQGCAGFVVGLIQAFMMLQQPGIKRVVLVISEVASKQVSPRDRSVWPLVGDGCSITVIESCDDGQDVFATLKMDGARGNAIQIPAGGYRMQPTPETACMEDAGDGNLRSKQHIHSDGKAVYNFVQTEVPPMVEELLELSESHSNEIDYFMFHQPNAFLLKQLQSKMGIPEERLPTNIVSKFGNPSAVSIPLCIAYNLGARMLDEEFTFCLAGFGTGLTWSSMYLKMGKFDFCDLIEFG